MTSLKTTALTLAITCTLVFATIAHLSAQTADLIYDDQDGPADAGSYPAGYTFTLSVSLSFAPGGSVANVGGLSYWLEQQSPLAPFYFSITNRDTTGTQFSFLQTPGLPTPQPLAPSNPNDLGAATQSGLGVGAGTYFLATYKISIARSAPPATYILENTTTGGKTSVLFDDHGHSLNIRHAGYTLTVVPFNIASITGPDNNGITLQCNGVPNHINRIEASPDLSPNSFQTLGSVAADSSGMFSFPDPNPGTRRFYRLAFP
jgi:hypothetical protein